MTTPLWLGQDDNLRYLREKSLLEEVTTTERMAASSTNSTGTDELVTSTDATIIRETLRVYGSLYLIFFLSFCILRKHRQKLFNIRSWVPELKCKLAMTQSYGFFSWSWQVFDVTDDELLNNCGMDALCFLRALRLGTRLSMWGALNAAWLIPLYLTAEESEETAYLTDKFVLMSIANLPIKSSRFAGTVVAAYVIVLSAMRLILQEYDWFTKYRHKYLSKRMAKNYAIYVSGIPAQYRSSSALAEYFQQCSWNAAVFEAHIAMDIPTLESKVAKREKVVEKLEHTLALERKKGVTQTHRPFNLQRGVEGVKKVASVEAYRDELVELNGEISSAIEEALTSNNERTHNERPQTEAEAAVEVTMIDGPYTDNYRGFQTVPITTSSSTLMTTATSFSTLDCSPGHDVGDDMEEPSSPPRMYRTQNSKTSSGGTKLVSAQSGSTMGNLSVISEIQNEDVPMQSIDTDSGSTFSLHDTSNDPACDHQSDSSQYQKSDKGDDDVASTRSLEMGLHPFFSLLGIDGLVFKSSGDRTHSQQEISSGSVISDQVPDNTMSETGDVEQKSIPGGAESNSVDLEAGQHPGVSDDSVSESQRTSEHAGENDVDDDMVADSTWSMGNIVRANAETVSQGMKKVSTLGVQSVKMVGTRTAVVGTVVKNAILDVNADAVAANIKKVGTFGVQSVKTAGSFGVTSVKKVADLGFQTIQYAPDLGVSLAATAAASAAAVVPMRIGISEGRAREAGFVVFNDLYTTQAARQMMHHPSANKMSVEPAPSPEEIFWRNVGLPAKAKRTGGLLSMLATSCLCFFWSIPSAFLSSLTEVNSLKEKLPFLEKWIEAAPTIETLLALIAPLLLLVLNELVLPFILKWFATWEGHVSSAALEASLFVKLCAFVLPNQGGKNSTVQIIQTFFVSAVSGTITAELSNMLDEPEKIVDLLANSLPAQSSFFLQVTFVFTFLLQGFDLIRAYPLGLAFFRRYFFGPNLTVNERRKTWKIFSSLEDPPEFWHAEIFAQIILFFVIFFVYSTIAPITSVFLGFCFVICESGYRYHFIHNHKTTPDSGGRLWQGFIKVLIASMLIGELTLVGLLVLKKTVYALPALAPLIAMTILFMFISIPKRNYVAQHLPTMLCAEVDKRNQELENKNSHFCSRKYLQPALRAGTINPDKISYN